MNEVYEGMNTKRFTGFAMVLALAACGGGDSAEAPADSAPAETAPAAAAAPAMSEMTMPEWFQMDEAARTVTLTITAGATDARNYWNYNGYTGGQAVITVPEGYAVTIEFVNDDPNMAHSVGISEKVASPSAAPTPTPVFEGAISSNPTSMVDGTMPGQSETLTFTASTAGEYTMLCYVPGHAATGMWLAFNVSSDGSAGVQTAM